MERLILSWNMCKKGCYSLGKKEEILMVMLA